MKRLTLILLILALMIPMAAFARQTKTAKPAKTTAPPAAKTAPATPSKTPADNLGDLVAQGKTADAVRLAGKNPSIVLPFLQSRLALIDLQITDRKIDDAKASIVAVEAFAKAYATSSKRKDIPLNALQGRSMRIEGILLGDKKQFEKSEEILKKALELAKSSGDKTLEAGVHNNLGYAIQYQQNPGGDEKLLAATEEYEAARKIAEEQKDNLRAASYNFNLGMVLLITRKYEPALNAFKRSTDQARDVSRPTYEARAVMYQGVALSKINLAGKEPITYFMSAAKLFEKLGDDRNTGWSFWLMAEQTAYTGDFKDAARCAELALPYLTKGDDKAGLNQCYEFLIDMYGRYQDDDSKAKKEKYQKLAEELRKQTSK
jgi:tetratricopeptide (TPR) repeat protein